MHTESIMKECYSVECMKLDMEEAYVCKPLQNHDFSKIAKLVKNYTKMIPARGPQTIFF